MPVEVDKHTDASYELIASVSQTHGCKKRVSYGIRVEYIGESTEVLKIKDISLNKSDVLRLILLLTEYGVAREHLYDIVEDYIQEL